MNETRVAWRAEDAAGTVVRVGDRPLHAFWPLLREHFRWVFLEPHRRASGDSILWMWNAPRSPPVPSVSVMSSLRQRMCNALADFEEAQDRSDATATPGELHQIIESVGRALVRLPDEALAARVVFTDAGWMIRSWGVSVPAPALCEMVEEVEINPPESPAAVVDIEGEPAGMPARSNRWRAGLGFVALALLLLALGAWGLWRAAQPAVSEGRPGMSSRQQAVADSPDDDNAPRDGSGSGSGNGAPSAVILSGKDGSAITGQTQVADVSIARQRSSEGGDGDASFTIPLAAKDGGEAGVRFSISSGPQRRSDGPDAVKPVPGRDGGFEETGSGGQPTGGTIDQARPSSATPAAEPSEGPGPMSLSGDAAIKPQRLPAAANAMPVAVLDADEPESTGEASKVGRPLSDKPVRPDKHKMPESLGDAPTPTTPPPEKVGTGSKRAATAITEEELARTETLVTGAVAATRGVSDRRDDDSPGAPARVVTVRIGDWRKVRVRDVVLSTWPEEQSGAQVLRAARERAREQILSSDPVSFHEPRVRLGWWLRLSETTRQTARPVWRDTLTGAPLAATMIGVDGTALSWSGLMPASDIDARLVAKNGVELARLAVSVRHRRMELILSADVLEAAPWWVFTPADAERSGTRFRWQSLLPSGWPDHAWAQSSADGGSAVICHSGEGLSAAPINGIIGLVEHDGGWALSCAVAMETGRSVHAR